MTQLLTMFNAYTYTAPESLRIDRGLPGTPNLETNNRFEIHTLDLSERQIVVNQETKKLERFEILGIHKGKGTLCIAEQEYEITENTIYCLAPGHVRKYELEIGTEAYFISFTPEFLHLSEGYSNNSSWHNRYNNDFKAATVRLDQEKSDEFEVIVRKMKSEFTNYLNQRLELLKGLLNIFMIYFSRNLKESNHDVVETRESELLRKFMQLLKKNYISQKMVTDYARQLYVTPNYLNRIVKNLTGFTASHHIQQQIMIEAKRQALYSSVTMKEVAYNLGFDNLAHFSKFFKNNCGMNFTEFKRQESRTA